MLIQLRAKSRFRNGTAPLARVQGLFWDFGFSLLLIDETVRFFLLVRFSIHTSQFVDAAAGQTRRCGSSYGGQGGQTESGGKRGHQVKTSPVSLSGVETFLKYLNSLDAFSITPGPRSFGREKWQNRGKQKDRVMTWQKTERPVRGFTTAD